MIFISHNHKDKILVEQIALRLREIFGQDKVFYDSWSMQPGDGIIDKMSEGLDNCELFLFFVSNNSLSSNMVKLEWQNALLKATKGKTKIVPIKLDNCSMQSILMQTLYIDLFNYGLEVSLRQIIDISTGRNTFNVLEKEFSNIKAYFFKEDNYYIVECHAEHYMEPISHFLFLVKNKEDEIKFTYLSGNMCNTGFNKDLQLNDGTLCNAQLISVESATVPGFPFKIKIEMQNNSLIDFIGVLHEKKQNEWSGIPMVYNKKN